MTPPETSWSRSSACTSNRQSRIGRTTQSSPPTSINSPQALRNYLSWARDVNHATEKLLHECIEAGVIRDDLDIGTSAHLLNGMLSSIARWFHSAGRLTADDLVDQVLGMLSGYIIAPA